MLHAKTLVVDGTAVVGTANLDNRSFRLNFEVAAAIFDVCRAKAAIFSG
jgi:cardiolipin synthase